MTRNGMHIVEGWVKWLDSKHKHSWEQNFKYKISIRKMHIISMYASQRSLDKETKRQFRDSIDELIQEYHQLMKSFLAMI